MDAILSQLHLYPIKGCRGFALTQATIAATGLEIDGIGDREWVIVDADGEFLSQREYPKLALVETRFTQSSLRLKAPGMLQLEVPFASEGDVVKARVWDDTVAAVTQGEVADAWFSNFLGVPARLLRFDPEHTRLASHRWTGKDEAPYKFADAFPLLVTSEASLADLNARLRKRGAAPVDMQRFRPNLVLAGIKPCARCSVPGVDPATGEHSSIVPDLLATYRGRTSGEPQGVMFGINAIVVAGAGSTLRVGSAAEVALKL